MSSAVEIEEAILNLPESEMEKLATWWESLSASRLSEKKKALKSTAGYLTEADNDFVSAVEEAGKAIPDSHEW